MTADRATDQRQRRPRDWTSPFDLALRWKGSVRRIVRRCDLQPWRTTTVNFSLPDMGMRRPSTRRS